MNGNVLVLDFHRRPSTPDDNATCPCGSQWFELRRRPSDPAGLDHGAVTINRDGSIVGYVGVPHCIECGLTLGQ